MKNMLLITDYDEMLLLAPQMEDDFKLYQEPFLFLVNGQPTIIGEIEITKIDVYVKMVRSLEERKGNGREFIDYLKRLPNKHEIWGESVIDAIPFWSKMGANFDKIVYRQYEEAVKEERELEEGFLLPFMIHCNSLELSRS